MTSNGSHALVFGASGLLGWSVVNELLSGYPKAGTFTTVTAAMNRPVSHADLHLPEASEHRPKLQIASGVNLLSGSGEDLARVLRDKVPGVDSVTHVFYFVFNTLSSDFEQECRINVSMMKRVADACNIVAPNLKSLVYSGGTRGYGIYIPGGTFAAPLTESMADNLPEDYARTVAYPWFRETLTKASQGRSWTWTEVCPDAVVGFSPNGSGYSLALHWAQYLSLYAYNHGVDSSSKIAEGHRTVEVPFPGNAGVLDSLFTPVSSRTVGRVAVHSAINPDRCGGKVINMADSVQPTTFRSLWPAIADWFGLKGVDPGEETEGLKPGEYVAKYSHVFEENGLSRAVECGVGAGSAQLDSVGWWLNFDRQLSLDRLRATGFTEERNPIEGWLDAFEAFKAAGIIL